MRDVEWRVLVAAGAVGIAAVVLGAFPPWGTLAAVAVVGAGSILLARSVSRRYVRPLRDLAPHATPGQKPLSAAELASTLAAEQRRAFEQVKDAASLNRRRETALAHTSDAVVIVEPTGIVEYANPTARLFLHDRVLDVTRRLRQPDLDKLVARANLTGQAVAEDVTLWIPGAKPARARAVPLADGATVLLLSDLSESYRLDRVRRDFVANVSHELKTPVAGIRALAETASTALSCDDLDTATRFIERLGTEATRLSVLISDLLDLSRVEASGAPELKSVELDSLLAEAADRARAIAEVKEIELVLHDTDVIVDADPSQLTMAIKNLVDNAVRYSEHGKVELGTYRADNWIVITVADEGIGIPTDEMPRIFERFYRVDKARSRATGGTGLGLAIVRHVAENHGGRVEVESELGFGSTFRLFLPARRHATNNGQSQ